MSKEINLKIDQDLLDKIREIAQKKNPLRKISTYAEATRESLIEFIEKNKKFLEAKI